MDGIWIIGFIVAVVLVTGLIVFLATRNRRYSSGDRSSGSDGGFFGGIAGGGDHAVAAHRHHVHLRGLPAFCICNGCGYHFGPLER